MFRLILRIVGSFLSLPATWGILFFGFFIYWLTQVAASI